MGSISDRWRPSDEEAVSISGLDQGFIGDGSGMNCCKSKAIVRDLSGGVKTRDLSGGVKTLETTPNERSIR